MTAASDPGHAPGGTRRRDAGLAALVLAVVTAAVFAPHVARGSLYWDDWENAATTHHPPPGFVGPFEPRLAAYRPGLALLLPLPHLAVGTRPAAQLAIAAALVWLMVAAFHALLRAAGVPSLHALAVCALALLFPYSTATRLWPTGAINNVAVALALVGVTAGLRALGAPPGTGRRRLRIAAVALPVAGVLTYEVVAVPALLGSLALYVGRVGWRPALTWWRPQAVGITLAALVNVVASTKEVQAPGTTLRHGLTIAEQGLSLLGRSLAPLEAIPAAAGVFAALLIGGGCALAASRMAASDPRRGPMRLAGRLLAAGVGLVAAGYAMFVPSHPAYSPLNPGTGDRVNVIAALGFALAAYGAALGAGGLVGAAVARRRRRVVTVAVGALLLAVVATGYGVRGREHQRQWEEAAALQQPVLRGLNAHAASLPPGATVFVVGHRRFAAPGVPVFATSWDLNGAIKASLGDPSLSAFPLGLRRRLLCRATTVGPYPTLDKREARPRYGRAFLLRAASGRLEPIRDRARCLALRRLIVAGSAQ